MTLRLKQVLQLLPICILSAGLGMATMYLAMSDAVSAPLIYAEGCAPSI
ncbi:hypothetical protein [Pseudomonas sp. ML96]|nr:hypothetical protein [Pseudomonas sp. ML96]